MLRSACSLVFCQTRQSPADENPSRMPDIFPNMIVDLGLTPTPLRLENTASILMLTPIRTCRRLSEWENANGGELPLQEESFRR